MSEGTQSQKVRQLLRRHGHAIGVCQSLSRAYFNLISLTECDGKMDKER